MQPVRQLVIGFLLVKGTWAQIEFAQANLGLRLTPNDGFVKAVPGRNPNLPSWFEDLGVENFGEILGNADVRQLKEVDRSVVEDLSEVSTGKDVVGGDSLTPAIDAEGLIDGKLLDQVFNATSNSTTLLNDTATPINGTETGAADEGRIIVKALDIPYPKEMNDEPISLDSSDANLLLPNEVDWQELPKAKSIPLWKPKPKGPMPEPLYILPDDEEGRKPSAIDTFRPIVATSTFTTKVSGQLVTSTTTSTVEKAALRFKSCIYGCNEMTSSDPLVGTTTIITVLPYQIPCSLVSCPPCPACFQSTVKVSVCPFVSTVPGKPKTAIVNGPTITVVRSTVTRTRCTATRTISAKPTTCSCPSETSAIISTETVTVTVERRISEHSDHTSLDKESDQQVEGSLTSASSNKGGEESEDYIIIGKDNNNRSNSTQASTRPSLMITEITYIPTMSTITETIKETETISVTPPTKKLPSITVTKTIVSEQIVVTVTTTALPVTTGDSSSSGICSTFIICNPTQFTCPAQITNLPQIQAVVQSIMDGQEKFGSAGVGSRKMTPNGAYIDEHGPEGRLGDGFGLMGGLAPVNGFGFGPGGMFEKVLGNDLIPPKPTEEEETTLLPPSDNPTPETKVSAAKLTMSTTQVVEGSLPTNASSRRSHIKKQQQQSSSHQFTTPLTLPLILAIALPFILV